MDYNKSKVNIDPFEIIYAELNMNNDYQSIQKIPSSIKKYAYSKEEKEILFK